MKQKLVIDCSPEQADIIADHLLEGRELGLLPDERAWMLSQARKQVPNCRVLGATLDIENAKWDLTVEVPNVTGRHPLSI